MSVSVIVPTFNRAAYIAASLDSVLGQSLPPSQVLVVDDGSTDSTSDVIKPYKGSITYLRKENGGKAAAINAALPMVTGEYLWVFDDDDVACPDALERQVRTLEANPNASFTFGHSYHCISHPRSGMMCIERERKIPAFPKDDYFFALLMSSYVASPAILVRTERQQAAGSYDESLVRSQDWDMGLRLGLIGPACRTEGESPTYYRRFHDGLRGTSGDQFAYSDYTTRARAAERIILRKLLGRIGSHHFLPSSAWGTPLNPELQRMAVLRRVSVFMRKGLWPEALDALEQAAELGLDRTPLASDEVRLMRRAVSSFGSIQELAEAKEASKLASVLGRSSMRQVRRLWTGAIYWHFRKAISARSKIQAIASLRALRLVVTTPW